MPLIELKNISKYVLRNTSLTVEDKEILALVGPNGAGKTTLLNVIAGLVSYAGNVFFDGKKMDSTPPHKRGIGYLFQDLALFPHLNVASNIAYGLKVQGYAASIINDRLHELMDTLHITKLKERYPKNLSGGEKQRVAIARAIAPFQKILLLDEPTSSLDAQTARYLKAELAALLKKLQITAVFVMHDLLGAEEIADRIAIIHNGQIEQIASSKDIFFHPKTDVVHEFIGMPNILTCDQCRVLTSGLIEVISGDMRIVLPYEGDAISKIAISPHDIYISADKPPGPALNRYSGIIGDIIPMRSVVRIKIHIGRNTLMAELPTEAFREMNIDVGSEVFAIVKLRRLRYFTSS